MNPGRLLFPAIRWHHTSGYEAARDEIERGLAFGAGGFILFGGTAAAAAALIRELRDRSPHPLLIAADLERGAGQQFAGATVLPPAAAFGALDDLAYTRNAGALTAREARAIGVNWILAPVADIDIVAENPIVGTRSFGADPVRVAAHVKAWIEGCREQGALATAKHFPGHGRTTGDSHALLPVVSADAGELQADLAPFAAAIDAGVDAIMSAHVAYPALDESGSPATLSTVLLNALLRGRLHFDGLIVTDALNMAGVQQEAGEAGAALRAVEAGCDVLLYPDDSAAAFAALDAARQSGRLDPQRLGQAIARVDAAARRANVPTTTRWGMVEDRDWAEHIALAAVQPLRGTPRLPANEIRLAVIDDDLGGPFAPPPRDAFADTLRRAGIVVRENEEADTDAPTLIAVYCDVRAWKQRAGCSARTIDAVRNVLGEGDAPVVLFGHPRIAAQLPGRNVLGAWGGESIMQQAAARWLLRKGSGE